MSWCDRLASTPALGFGLDHHILSQGDIVRALSPVLDEVFAEEDGNKLTFQQTDPFSLAFKSTSGLSYGVEPTKLHVTFEHILRHRHQSGAPPVAQLLSKPQPFTKLLPEVSDQAVRVALLVNGLRSRSLVRAGVVSTTHVDSDDLPPGLVSFLEYVGAPWKSKMLGLELSITTELKETQHTIERCIHVIKRPEKLDELTTVQLDFQVLFKNPKPISESVLKSESELTQKRALDYFESIAEGAMFDAEIIKSVKPDSV